MLFILQVLRELALPVLTDTEITCTGVVLKFRGKLSERGPKTSSLLKVEMHCVTSSLPHARR